MSVQCLQVVTLLTPSGEELAIGMPGIEYHQFESVRPFVVPRPAPGVWKAIASGRGFFSMIVTAKTDLRLGNVAFSNTAAAVPNRGNATSLEATVSGAFRQAAFPFRRGQRRS